MVEQSEKQVTKLKCFRSGFAVFQAVKNDQSFESYAKKFDAYDKVWNGTAQPCSDGRKIPFREGDELIFYFGIYDAADSHPARRALCGVQCLKTI